MDGDTRDQHQASIRDEVEHLRPWFHNLHLPDGTQTAPDHFLGDFPAYKWQELDAALPADLRGWSALDVGCNAGFYSFELARRGAQVRGIDSSAHYLAQARWAASRFGLENCVEFEQRNIYSLLPDERQYDLVLFMGLLYHLRYPLLGLDILARRTRRLFGLLTLSVPGEAEPVDVDDLPFHQRDAMHEPGWPNLAFIEHRFAEDPTTWWIPNHAAIEALVRSAGLRLVARPGWELYVCEPAEMAVDAVADDYEVLRALAARQ